MPTHETTPGDAVYGPGTFIDKTVLPVQDDARRVFELLASQTPRFTKDKAAWDTVSFSGKPTHMIPGPIKSPVVASALHGMAGLLANELLELRDGKDNRTVNIDTDHAGLWLGSVFTTYIDGVDTSGLARTGKLHALFPPEQEFDQGFGRGIAGRTTAIYQTKDPKVWYQLHGSLDAKKTLESMGIDPSVEFDKPQKYYDYIQEYVKQWSPDELEMHNVRHGLCGSICYTPQGWRETQMGKILARHPLVNVTEETYAKDTPAVPMAAPKGQDRRPLAGIKVLEMVRIIAGPQIGVTLASYGADVIRVNCSRLADLSVSCHVTSGRTTVFCSQ